MIQRQNLFGKFCATVVAMAGADLLFPPQALSELLGLAPLAFDMFWIRKTFVHALFNYHGRALPSSSPSAKPKTENITSRKSSNLLHANGPYSRPRLADNEETHGEQKVEPAKAPLTRSIDRNWKTK